MASDTVVILAVNVIEVRLVLLSFTVGVYRQTYEIWNFNQENRTYKFHFKIIRL
jgi:hypothetical protein